MSESEYFEQFAGSEPGIICEYCGGFIPEGEFHTVRMRGTEYIRCFTHADINRSVDDAVTAYVESTIERLIRMGL